MFTFLNSISSNITEAKLQRLAVWWWGNWTGRWGRELLHIVGWSGKENIRGRESKLAAKRIRVVKSGVYVLILSPMYVCMFSPVQLFATLWTTARQAPLSMKCSRQEYWSGLPFPSPGDLPDPGIKPKSLVSPSWAGGFLPTTPPGKPCHLI